MIGAVLCFFGRHAWRREWLYQGLTDLHTANAPICERCRRCRAIREAKA